MTIVCPTEHMFAGIAHRNTSKSQVAYYLSFFPYERNISIAANP